MLSLNWHSTLISSHISRERTMIYSMDKWGGTGGVRRMAILLTLTLGSQISQFRYLFLESCYKIKATLAFTYRPFSAWWIYVGLTSLLILINIAHFSSQEPTHQFSSLDSLHLSLCAPSLCSPSPPHLYRLTQIYVLLFSSKTLILLLGHP